jgi:SAM-dependent methyltransferase
MEKQKVELAFGRIPAYCKYELFMERYRSAAEIIRGQIVLTEDTKLLDVGCGEGYMKYFFDENEGKWFGVECWKERAEVCRGLGYDVVEIDINGTPLPYPNEFFSVVIASHVIEHLSDVDFCLQQMSRVLKKGGIMLVATPTKPPGTEWTLQFLHNLKKKRLGETQHAFNSLSLKKRIQASLKGYDLVDYRGFRIFSARKKLKLENSYGFYRISVFLGRHLTFLTREVNLIFRKKA